MFAVHIHVHAQGLVKNIGVSNCSIKKLQLILDNCKTPPAVNQVEVHPLWRNGKLIDFCNEKGIHVSAYCPMGTPWTSAKAVIRRALPCSKVKCCSFCILPDTPHIYVDIGHQATVYST